MPIRRAALALTLVLSACSAPIESGSPEPQECRLRAAERGILDCALAAIRTALFGAAIPNCETPVRARGE